LSNDLAAKSIEAGLESGDIQFVSYAMLWQSCNNYYQGMALPDFVRELQRFSQFVHKTKDQLSIAVVLAETFALVDILGLKDNTWLPVSIDELNEEQYVKDCQDQDAFLPLCLYYIFKLQTSFVLNNYKKANEFAAQADKLLEHIFLAISVVEHNFYSSLTLTALYPEASKEEQRTYLQQLDSNQKQMKIWVDNCPENFLNMYLLVDAEIARIKGNDLQALDLYDQAVASAHKEGFIQNEAIANELCARFWLGKEKDEFFGLYMVKAHHCYHKWGAKNKAADLEKKYPQFLSCSEYEQFPAISSTNVLDLNTVIKASQAISMEIGMKSLLPRIITIMIENAGAQKGILILNQENELIIKAIASGPDDIEIFVFKPIENCRELPEAIVRYVFRTGEDIILHDAQEDVKFSEDAYIIENQPKSILCMPVRYQNEISGVLYLENNLAKKVFSKDRILLLNLLLSQAAISLENARLFENLSKEHDALLKSEDTLSRMFSFADYMVCIADLKKGYFTKISPAFTKHLGWSEKEMLSKPIIDFIHPDDLEKTLDIIKEQMEKEVNVIQFENRYRTNKGDFRWFEWAANPVPEEGITYSAAYDITERKLTEATLEKQRKIHQAIINKADTHLVFLDTDFNFVAVNSKYAQSCHYTPEELIGKNHFYLFPHEENKQIFRQLLDTGQPVSYHDKPFEYPDQPERGVTYWDWTLSPVFDNAGKVEGLVFSLQETTERKKAEEKIKASLKEKEVLLREIHHRTKNNMQVLSSLLNLQADQVNDQKYADLLKDSQERIKSMALIHEKLYQSKDFTRIDFSTYVETLVRGLTESFAADPGKIAVKTEVEDIVIGIDNGIPCGLIINELVSNSLKYAFPQDRSGEIMVTLCSINENEVELTVSDDGIGIPEDLDFRNTESLGLHLVKILAQRQLGGKIKLDKTKGTKFHIRFKATPDQARI
ncbi:MAG: PAS domain S-box protein, partial [Desulfobacteraceae bacterium]|nr:PAS domain S-box protein [Desulfobacteraceae bacterium]